MRISIDSEWYDLSKWAPFHPGGADIIKLFDGQDATDAFYSLHSPEAVSRLRAMAPTEEKQESPSADPLDEQFRAFRAKLEKDGWFRRSILRELLLLTPIIVLVVLGTAYSYTHPLLSAIAIGIAMQQAGWTGHDYTHARSSTFCDTLLPFVSGWINGFDRTWWSRKHNTHHVLTNHIGIDPDIDNRPVLFLWAPPKSMDHHLRKYQHFYYPVLYSLLYASWRMQSAQCAWARRDYKVLLLQILPSYLWLLSLPLSVAIGSILIGGFLVAVVVTLSHESEHLTTERMTSYARIQFDGTCDVICPDPVSEYLFGGMQYQLVHHLFPTMPRYHYPAMVPLVAKFAAGNNIAYRRCNLGEMMARHFATLKANALVAAVEQE